MRVVRFLLAVVLTLLTLGGVVALGVSTSMAGSFRTPPTGVPLPAARTVPEGRIPVAVVLGADGSVVSDVLAPFEVFARSERFFVYTVAARREPVALSGGLHVLPDYAFDAAPEPDVLVVPAVVDVAEPALRAWIAGRAARGARVLGVCAGSEVLAATGVLDGRSATSHWAVLGSLAAEYPKTRWVRGQRFVEDGPVVTTAGVTSGIAGALWTVRRLAGDAEAARIGADLGYPGWTSDGPAPIPALRIGVADLPYGLAVAFPWFRPRVGLGLVDGVGEIDVAAVAEANTFGVELVPVAAGSTVTTRHGLVLLATPVSTAGPGIPADAPAGTGTAGPTGAVTDGPDVERLVVPGGRADRALTDWARARHLAVDLPGPGFGPALRDLARRADRATAAATARYIEYPVGDLDGPAWSWRPTALLAATLLIAVGAGLLLRLGRNFSRNRGAPPNGPALTSTRDAGNLPAR
ncbi:DJ-1/PfpI family protein [Longispora sp. K20-0274]|uniref:DJ-1/PfpI family protein n=1 Tax=Longispora sp. K20-0274 TaxID=3088255 RepID=UPI00399982C5